VGDMAWAAVAEGREEEGYQAASTRAMAVALVAESLAEDADCGHEGPGQWVLEVVEGCVWHERCTDDGCDYCPSGSHEWWLHDWAAKHRVVVEVYAVPDGGDPDLFSHEYQEVTRADD
jgi:hypothetical protein